jgi:ankyrin repeat protein
MDRHCKNDGPGMWFDHECSSLIDICRNKDIKTLQFLLNQGFDFKCQCSLDSQNYSAIHRTDDIEIINFLLENGFDVNDAASNGMTPLHLACSVSNTELAKFLIKKGANVNAQTIKKSEHGIELTPLLYASFSSNFEIIELLVENGATVIDYSGKKFYLNLYNYTDERRDKVDEFIEGLNCKNIKPAKK